MNLNDKIEDVLIDRQLLVERLKTYENKKIYDVYLAILSDLKTKLNSYDIVDVTNANKILKELDLLINPELSFVIDDYKELAYDEVQFISGAFNSAATIDIFNKLPTKSTLEKIANAPLYLGATMKETFSNLDANLKFNIEQQVKQAVIQGESIYQVKQRLNTIFRGKYKNEIERIARTSVHTVVNQAREEFYNENLDIIKGYKSISVLDNRTSNICISYADKLYDANKKPIGHNLKFMPVPRHPQCRSIIVPITKSYKELGIEELTPATRASIDGQIPQDTTFKQWLDKKPKAQIEQILGKGKAELYLDGKITLSELVTQRGRPLTLVELREKYD